MRKLIESVEQIQEGYFSRLSVELDELYRSHPSTPDENLIAFVGRKYGDEAADFFRSQIESGEYEQSLGEEDEGALNDRYDDETLECKHCGSYFCTSKFGGECPEIQKDLFDESEIQYLKHPEGYEPPKLPERHILDTMDWMHVPDDVIQMMKSFEHKMKSQNVWDKGVELADGEDKLWKNMQWRAEEVMDTYRGSGDGIGTSDMNHFVRGIFSDLGEDDIWGWDKPKLASDEDMERDKTNRAARFRNPTESIEEASEIDEVVSEWMKRLDRL